MTLEDAIRLRALRVVLRPDREYFLRRVMRWYSKTFYTPLAQVEDIPTEDLLQTWYEERYAEMAPEDLDRERAELLETPEQRYERILREEADEAEMFEMSRVVAAEEERKKAAKAKEKKIAETQPALGPIKPVEMSETDLPRPVVATVPPDITMSFVDDAAFQAELEGFGSMTQPLKP